MNKFAVISPFFPPERLTPVGEDDILLKVLFCESVCHPWRLELKQQSYWKTDLGFLFLIPKKEPPGCVDLNLNQKLEGGLLDAND
ncbi:hypothetical protein ACRYI5_10355 [Furfurilactobacillus sp. WILCCON 0119]